MAVTTTARHYRGDDRPKRVTLGRNLTATERTDLFTGSTVTVTINGTAVVASLVSASAGTFDLTLPEAVYDLAAGSYSLLVRMVDSDGFTLTLATGSWLQREAS
jgi:hypothetical protein